jgi:hypothetical protein
VVWALGTVSLAYMLLSTIQTALLRGLNLPTGSLQGMASLVDTQAATEKSQQLQKSDAPRKAARLFSRDGRNLNGRLLSAHLAASFA